MGKLCGDKLCVTSGVWTSCGRAAGVIEDEAKVHNQKQEPHTKMWGKRNQSSLPLEATLTFILTLAMCGPRGRMAVLPLGDDFLSNEDF